MAAIPSETERDLTPPASAPAAPWAPKAITRPSLGAILAEYFLRIVVVSIGVGIGLIAAVIIGFTTGWIGFEFGC